MAGQTQCPLCFQCRTWPYIQCMAILLEEDFVSSSSSCVATFSRMRYRDVVGSLSGARTPSSFLDCQENTHRHATPVRSPPRAPHFHPHLRQTTFISKCETSKDNFEHSICFLPQMLSDEVPFSSLLLEYDAGRKRNNTSTYRIIHFLNMSGS